MFERVFLLVLDGLGIGGIEKANTLKHVMSSYDLFIPNTKTKYIDILPDKKTNKSYETELVIFKNSMPILLSYIFELYYNGFSKKEISILLDENIEEINTNFNIIKKHALTYKSLFFA